MAFKSAVMEDRYKAFRDYRSKSPFYDLELNAFILLNFGEIESFLKNGKALSNRKKTQFDALGACPYSTPLIDFYSQWLMYMDGEEHQRLRKIVNNSLLIKTEQIASLVEKEFHKLGVVELLRSSVEVDFCSAVSAPAISAILSQLIGISPEDYSVILQKTLPIVAFLGNGDVGDPAQRTSIVRCIHEANGLIEEILHKKAYSPDSVLAVLLQECPEPRDLIPLILNIVIDGYEPLLSSVNNLLYFVSTSTEPLMSDPDWTLQNLIAESLRLENPFQYCARILNENFEFEGTVIEKGSRVMCFVSAANRDPTVFDEPELFKKRHNSTKHLAYGSGKHFCPGSRIANKVLEHFYRCLSQGLGEQQISMKSVRWNKGFGYRYIEELIISVNGV